MTGEDPKEAPELRIDRRAFRDDTWRYFFSSLLEGKIPERAEMLILDSAQALAYYDRPFFGKYPGIARNSYGKGMFT